MAQDPPNQTPDPPGRRPEPQSSPPPPPPPPPPPGSGVEIAPGVRVQEKVLEYATSRASGPGGQNVNRRETRVQLRVALDAIPITPTARARLKRLAGSLVTDSGDLLIASEARRTQLANRRACLERLRDLVVRARAEPKRRKKTKPSRGSIERRIKEKKQRGEKKQRRRWSGE